MNHREDIQKHETEHTMTAFLKLLQKYTLRTSQRSDMLRKEVENLGNSSRDERAQLPPSKQGRTEPSDLGDGGGIINASKAVKRIQLKKAPSVNTADGEHLIHGRAIPPR